MGKTDHEIVVYENTPCVYFVSDGNGNCKVGMASDFRSRYNNLQVGNAAELNVLHLHYTDTGKEAKEYESEVHYALRNHVVRGEWYQEDAVLDYLARDEKEEREKEKAEIDRAVENLHAMGFRDFVDFATQFLAECDKRMKIKRS